MRRPDETAFVSSGATAAWRYLEILQQFIEVCCDKTAATYAAVLAQDFVNKLHAETSSLLGAAA